MNPSLERALKRAIKFCKPENNVVTKIRMAHVKAGTVVKPMRFDSSNVEGKPYEERIK